MGEWPQSLLDLPTGFALARFAAEEDDHLLGPGTSALAALHQTVGKLPGGGGPVVRFRGDTEPGAAAEPAPSVLVVQGDQHDAVLGAVSEQVGQRVGEFGRGAQGDLLRVAVMVVRGAGDVRRARYAVFLLAAPAGTGGRGAAHGFGALRKVGAPAPVTPGDVAVFGGSGRFAVVRHAKTISRNQRLRFALWIKSDQDTSRAGDGGRPGAAIDLVHLHRGGRGSG
ncbi:hypothetical protein SGRIM128S_00400 [Streptomyces griseomycini]